MDNPVRIAPIGLLRHANLVHLSISKYAKLILMQWLDFSKKFKLQKK